MLFQVCLGLCICVISPLVCCCSSWEWNFWPIQVRKNSQCFSMRSQMNHISYRRNGIFMTCWISDTNADLLLNAVALNFILLIDDCIGSLMRDHHALTHGKVTILILVWNAQTPSQNSKILNFHRNHSTNKWFHINFVQIVFLLIMCD